MTSEIVKPGRVNGEGLLRSIYNFSLPDDEWLRAILVTLKPAVPSSLGAHGTVYDVTPEDRLNFGTAVALDGAEPSVSAFLDFGSQMTPRMVRQIAAQAPVSVASHTGLELFARLKRMCFTPCNAADSLNVNQFGDTAGINLGFMLPRIVDLSQPERRFLLFVAQHLSAATNARQALRDAKRGVVPWSQAFSETEPLTSDLLSFSRLTPREREVWTRRKRGESAKAIAFSLSLSHSTIRVLLARADRKMR